MQRKNLLVICAAAGLCMVSVLFLAGSMGIYAEKSGTREQAFQMTAGEPEEAFAKALLEEGEPQEKENAISEEELGQVWEDLFLQSGSEAVYEDTYLRNSPEVGLSESEVGLIVLKELNRLYPNDSLEDLQIGYLQVENVVGINGEEYVEWVGDLDNGRDAFADADHISYSFHVDAVSGKITRFGKFHPYQKGVDYAAIAWTDEEIIARAKELIAVYDLTDGEELDWSDVELCNGADDLESLAAELEEGGISVQVSNVLIFKKDGQQYFTLCMDWETGEISDYVWLDRLAM